MCLGHFAKHELDSQGQEDKVIIQNCLNLTNCLFSVRCQIVNILGFVGLCHNCGTFQHCHCVTKIALGSLWL